MIEKLELGHEFCGICGRDVTDAPDCMHSNQPLPWSTSGHGQNPGTQESTIRYGKVPTRETYEDTLFSYRVGCEMLLDTENLKYLQCFDMPSPFALANVRSYRYCIGIAGALDNPAQMDWVDHQQNQREQS